MPKAAANGIQIGYEISGQGEPLVLIPGISYDRWMWRKMIPGLAEHFQVISVDNRGSGESDSPPGSYTAEMMAQDTTGLLDALEIPQAHILGHSMGGFVAQALAIHYPHYIKKLILSSTTFGGPRHIPITQEALAVLTDITSPPLKRFQNGLDVSTAPGFAEAHPEIIQEWIEYRLGNPIQPAAYQSQLAVGLSLVHEANSFEQHLAQIDKPTLVLSGAEDKVVPPGNARLIADRIPNSRLHILENAGHFYPLETPEAAVRVVVVFLKEG
jgi:pimeloyl-ACP methyl ester carboxylesterase